MIKTTKVWLKDMRNVAFNTLGIISGSNKRWFSEREDFLQVLPKQGIGAELGVFKGEFTKGILQVTAPKELHLVDVWWEKFGDFYPNWGNYTDFGHLKTRDAYESVKRVIERYGANTNVVLQVGDDVIHLKTLPDGYFDWVYLDSTHEYKHTKLELLILKDKVKINGVIAGHDWIEDPKADHYGVYKAIYEFCRAYKWEVVLVDNFSQWIIRRAV